MAFIWLNACASERVDGSVLAPVAERWTVQAYKLALLTYWAEPVADRPRWRNTHFGIALLAWLVPELDIELVCGRPIAGVVVGRLCFLVY